MNFRSRELLNLAYELDCTVRIPLICTGGTGEPAHANAAIWGKGGAMKAHDFAFASACRACHQFMDQGPVLDKEARVYYWLRGHVETMRQLWENGLLSVTGGAAFPEKGTRSPLRKLRPSKGNTSRPTKIIPRSKFV